MQHAHATSGTPATPAGGSAPLRRTVEAMSTRRRDHRPGSVASAAGRSSRVSRRSFGSELDGCVPELALAPPVLTRRPRHAPPRASHVRVAAHPAGLPLARSRARTAGGRRRQERRPVPALRSGAATTACRGANWRGATSHRRRVLGAGREGRLSWQAAEPQVASGTRQVHAAHDGQAHCEGARGGAGLPRVAVVQRGAPAARGPPGTAGQGPSPPQPEVHACTRVCACWRRVWPPSQLRWIRGVVAGVAPRHRSQASTRSGGGCVLALPAGPPLTPPQSVQSHRVWPPRNFP